MSQPNVQGFNFSVFWKISQIVISGTYESNSLVKIFCSVTKKKKKKKKKKKNPTINIRFSCESSRVTYVDNNIIGIQHCLVRRKKKWRKILFNYVSWYIRFRKDKSLVITIFSLED